MFLRVQRQANKNYWKIYLFPFLQRNAPRQNTKTFQRIGTIQNENSIQEHNESFLLQFFIKLSTLEKTDTSNFFLQPKKRKRKDNKKCCKNLNLQNWCRCIHCFSVFYVFKLFCFLHYLPEKLLPPSLT